VFNTVMRTHLMIPSSLVFALAASTAAAQTAGLKLPDASPAASVSQTVGLTKLEVDYHRPAVAGRKIWGDLVPYGQVWRAGANENTTVTVSTPVKIGGKMLPAGTYGLHILPTTKEWTVIFSKMAVAWGSFTYDAKEDALRVAVTPQSAEAFTERLAYDFDNPTETATTLMLRWEKTKLPIPIEVDTPQVVMADVRAQLRGLPNFGWLGWAQAAQFWLTHGGNLDEAQRFADKSIGMRETYQNLSTRAAIADKRGDAKTATAMRAKAEGVATETDLNQAGYALLADKKIDQAIAVFEKNVHAHPASWNVHDSLAEALAIKGDRQGAVDSYAKALTLVKDDVNKKRIEQVLTRLKGK
jgi:tetratricopeptide (TPR) repeat protein